MLSIQAETSQVTPSNVDGYRPKAATDVVVQLFAPVRIETDLNGLIEEIRRRKDKADFETNRPVISCMILLGHSMDLVEEAKIDEALADGWEATYRLYQEVVTKIADRLNQESMSIAGIELEHNDFEPLSFEIQQSQGNGSLLIIESCPRFSQFSLLDMDLGLAKAVAGCLKWTIFNGGAGMLVDDLFEGTMMVEEELDAIKEALSTQSHLSDSELAEFFLENDVYPFPDLTDDREYLEDRIGYLKSVLTNNCKSLFGELPEIGEIRRMVAGWRKSKKAVYKNPWVKFIRETIRAWKWIERSGLKASECLIAPCDDSHGDVYLDYAHVIGFGFDWEETVVNDFYDDMAQVGENPAGIIELNPLACSEVGERLTLLAKSRGLIRLAEIINADFEIQSEA